jgi:N-acetylneuraminic acid mutarotase
MNTNGILTTRLGVATRLLAICGLLFGLASPGLARQAITLQPEEPLAWSAATPIPYPWIGPRIQCPGDAQHFYLVGGVTKDFVDLADVSRYDIQAGTWETNTIADLPSPNRLPTLACYQDKIFAAGGLVSGNIVNNLYVYDISLNTWAPLAPLPVVNFGAALGAWDGKLYLAGGNSTGWPFVPPDSVHVYDITTDTWTPNGGTPMPVAANFGGYIQAGPYLYVVGGLSGDFDNNLPSTQRYDMSRDQWEQGPLFISRRAATGLAITEDSLYALGGDANGGGDWDDATDYVERLDLSQWPGGAWTDISDPLPAVVLFPGGFCSEALTGGEIWSVGGTMNFDDTNLYRHAEPCLLGSYSLTLEPDNLSASGWRGATVEYSLAVTNTGEIPDAYTVEIASNWMVSASTPDPLWPGESAAITVTVAVPYTATLGSSGTATLTVTSQGDPTQSDSSTITTTAVTDWVEAQPVAHGVAAYGFAQCPGEADRFYVIGGAVAYVGGAIATDAVRRYNAVTDTWTDLADLPLAIFQPACACYQGKIYAAGGYKDGYLDSLYIYDIAANNWSSGEDLPHEVLGAAIGAWNGRLYLAGGAGEPWPAFDDVDVYDIATDHWFDQGGASMPWGVQYPAYQQTGPYLWAVGGYNSSYDANLDTTQRYDMSSNTWDIVRDFASQQAWGALAATESHLYAIGGDVDGNSVTNPTDEVETLAYPGWPSSSWAALGDPLPQALVANSAGFCTEAISGGEVWSVGGIYYKAPDVFFVDSVSYRPVGEPCLGYNYGMTLAPAALGGSGKPGEIVNHTLTVTNTGDTPDAYTVLVTSDWAAEAPEMVGALYPGESVSLLVTVTVPLDVLAGEQGVALVTVTSQGDPAAMAQATLTTTALESYGVSLAPDSQEQSALPGDVVTYTLQITNSGNVTDTFDLSTTGGEWVVTLPVTPTNLEAGASLEVTVQVLVPVGAADGDQDSVTITAISHGDPTVTAIAELSTTAAWIKVYLPFIKE